MIVLLANRYGMSAEGAREVIAELRNTRSLQDLTQPRARGAQTVREKYRRN